MKDTGGSINITEYTIPEMLYTRTILARGYNFSIKYNWPSVKPSYQALIEKLNPNVLASIILGEDGGAAVLYEYKGVLVIADIDKKKVKFEIAGESEAAIRAHSTTLYEIYPQIKASEDKVKVKFWYNTNQGPTNVPRQIVVPEWQTITDNYDPKTLSGLEYLMKEFKPDSGGQLIVFHGPPGTGKSYSLRALLHAWKEWCVADYILDPENLFSGSQGYMASLVLRGASDSYEYDEDEEQPVVKEDDKWKLLILEDSGELLSADAKQRTGQGLSRLLNLVDGLIGQGLRVLVLITTNEDFTKLHPAVSREGRCAAAIKFRPFEYKAAKKWLLANDQDTFLESKEYTLAELFAKVRGEQKDDRMFDLDIRTLGFKPI